MRTFHPEPVGHPKLTGAKTGFSGKGELRRENRRIILETLFHRSKASRIDLVRMCGLSPSTVGQIVGELIEDGVLIESGTVELKRGRKPRLVEINPDAGVCLGVELSGGTAAAFDLQCQVRARFGALSSEPSVSPESVVQAIADLASELRDPGPVAIGVSVPGSVDRGHVITSTPLGWNDVPLGSMLTDATGLLVVVQPNMVSLVLEEAASGIAQNVANFIYLHLGMRGIAAGIAVDGRIMRGAHLNAGEIGHLQIDPEGPPCHCGKRGCLGVIASGDAVLEAARQEMRSLGRKDLPSTVHDLTLAALAGEPVALAHLRRAGEAIGNVLAGAINLINPELIVVGGAFAVQSAKVTLPVIEDAALARSAFRGSTRCSFKIAEDASFQSARGAARAGIHQRLIHVARQSGDPD